MVEHGVQLVLGRTVLAGLLPPVNPAMGNVRFEGPECIAPPPPEAAAVTGDAPGGPPRTRKPRAKQATAGDLFTINE